MEKEVIESMEILCLFRIRKPKKSTWFEAEVFCALSSTLESQIKNLLKEGFPKGTDEDRYCSTPYAHVCALEKGRVIGVAKLFERTIVFNGETVAIGGFGGVTTKKNKRRKGVATAVLRRGMEDFKMRNFDIAFLRADVNNPAYTRLYGEAGFVPLGKPYVYRGKSGTNYVDYNGMVAPVMATGDFKDVLSAKEIPDIGMGNW